MLLPINDQWRIVSDEQCWKVQRYAGVYKSGKRANQPKWQSRKYCSTLASAVKQAALVMVLEADTTTATEALAVIQRVADAIDSALLSLAARVEELLQRQGGAQHDERPVK